MKIEKVDTALHQILGDAEIHMNKEGVFSLKYDATALPEDYKYDQLPTSTNLAEMRQMIREFCENCVRQRFIKQKIFIAVGTSANITPYDGEERKKDMFSDENWKLFQDGDGLYISYMIVNIYECKYKARVGSTDCYIKNHTTTYDPIYGWKTKELYEIVGGNSTKFNQKGKLQERYQALFSFKYTHEMDYDPKIEEFLKSVTSSLGQMVAKIANFFNVAPVALLEKVNETNGLKLLGTGS